MSNGNGHHWSKFVWRDHTGDPALRACSLATRGYWMAMLCIMHEGTPIGHLTVNGRPVTTKQMAALAACTEREARKCEAELEEARIFSRTEAGVIYCRRMARDAVGDAAAREAWQAYGAAGGNPNIIRGTVAKEERQRPYRRSDAPQKTERIFQRDGGQCHWCHEPLVRDNPRHPLYFHVDHIVAVRDGGGTDEANLVAACQRCNMKRARHDTTPDSPPPAPTKPNGTDPYIPAYKPPGTLSDSNPTEIPTATLGSIRQQGSDAPTATLAPALESEPESQVQPEREERKSKYNPLISPVLARVAAACETPPEGTYGSEPKPTALQLATKTVVEKLGRKLESSGKIPSGKRAQRTAIEQASAVLYGEILDADYRQEPLHRGPVDPQRTVAEQLAALGFPHLVEARPP